MKKFIALALLTFNIGSAQVLDAKATVEKFFTAFHAQDTLGLRSLMSDQIVFQTIAERKVTKLSSESAADFIKGIAEIPTTMKFEERILSWQVNASGALAHVWAPYEFYIDGKMSHRGVNSFTLYNDEGVWKIVHCIDTRKK